MLEQTEKQKTEQYRPSDRETQLSRSAQDCFQPLEHTKNSTPSALHSVLDFGTASDLYGAPDAQKTPKVAQNLDYDGRPPTLLPDPSTLDAAAKVTSLVIDKAGRQALLEAERQWNPYRGHISEEMQKIPESAWHQAYEAFPQFKNAGLSEKQVTEVMKAIVRNELYNYDKADQEADDNIRAGRTPLLSKVHYKPEDRLTLGYPQLSIAAVREREAEYPKQINFAGREKAALMDPTNTPLLVAATLAHNADMYQRHHIPVTEKSLGYSYNPPAGRILPTQKDLEISVHAANIMHHLAIVRNEIQPKQNER